MAFQPRLAMIAISTAAILSACGDGSGPITGENSVITSTSIPVIGPDGSNITAVNQQNFPLAGALPLPGNNPILGAALPEDTGAENATGAPSTSAAAQTDFFHPLNALSQTDINGSLLISLIASISDVVANEYAAVTTVNTASTNDTLQISNRMANKVSCDEGSVESSFDMNGTAINAGSVVFSGCGSLGYVLNGDIVLASDNSGNAENVRVGLRSVTAWFNDSTFVFNGTVDIEFRGEEFTVTSDNVELAVNGDIDAFSMVNVTGQMSTNGARTLTGSTRFNDQDSDEYVDYSFTDVSVFNNANIPSSGTTTLMHSDRSRIDFNFETGDPATFTYSVTQSDGSIMTLLESWENVDFRVPTQ